MKKLALISCLHYNFICQQEQAKHQNEAVRLHPANFLLLTSPLHYIYHQEQPQDESEAVRRHPTIFVYYSFNFG